MIPDDYFLSICKKNRTMQIDIRQLIDDKPTENRILLIQRQWEYIQRLRQLINQHIRRTNNLWMKQNKTILFSKWKTFSICIYMNQIYNKFLKKYPNGSHQNEQIIHSLISDENNDDISILLWLQDLPSLKIPHQLSFLYELNLRCPH